MNTMYCESCGWSTSSTEHLRECGADAPWLDPDSAALSGLAGDVVTALAAHTEADPAGLLLNLLASFGAMAGSMAESEVGFAHHPPALFVRSSAGPPDHEREPRLRRSAA